MTKTVDQWTAEQAGVIVGKSMYTLPDGKRVLYPFTLNDARCREIVRDHFDIDTIKTLVNWYSRVCMGDPLEANSHIRGEGETIAEAECNCITAIYEASQ